jgi:hypothetical protein
MLSMGPSALPKNVRDLIFQTFVGIMDADLSIFFMLNEGNIKRIWL